MTRSVARAALLAALALAVTLPVAGTAAPQASPDPLTPQIARLLEQMKAADTDLLAVSEEDGRLLRLLIASSRTKSALEIGAANGYSADLDRAWAPRDGRAGS